MKKFLLSIFAVLFAFAGVQAQTWTKVTDASTLKAGDQLVIACSSKGFVASATISSNIMEKLTATFSSDYATITSLPEGAAILTLGGVSGTWTLANEDSKLLGATAVKKVAWGSGTTTWSISIDASGCATIQNSTSSYGRFLYNVNSPRFTTYTSNTSSSMLLPQLYRLEAAGGEGEGEGGGETPEPVDVAEPTFTPADGTAFDESLDVTITAEDGLTVYYSTDNKASYTEGNSLNITETTTIYAYAEDADGNQSDDVSATYTKNTPVTPPAEGEVVDVLNRELTGITKNSSTYSNWSDKTVSSSAVYAGQSAGGNDAIQLRSNNSNSGIVTTTSGGKAKKVVVDWQSSTVNDRTLNVYGKNSAYTAATDLYSTSTQGTLLGTIVKGTSTELEIEGDYEYIGVRSASGAIYLTSISITWDESAGVTPVAPNAPVLPESTTFEGSMLVEITGIAADATVYYTTDESDPTISATRVEYTEPFEITATTTVKAVAVNEVGASEMATATYTLFVVEETTGFYIKVVSAPADWSGKYLIVYEEGTDAYVFNGKDEANGYVSAVTDGDLIKANSEIDAVAVTIAAMEGGYSVKTANGYIYGASDGNKLYTNSSEPQLNTIEFTADGVNIEAGRYLRFNSAKGDMRFRYYNLTYGESVQLYKYVEELPLSHTLTVTNAGYATLYLGFNARIPSAVEAYTVTAVNNGWVSLTKVTGVLPSNQGVIIKAPAGDYKFFYEETATADVTGNLLSGSAYGQNITEEAYVLGNVDGVGLYKAEMNQLDGTAWLNNANKAYLPASAVSAAAQGAASFSFRFEGDTTGIDEITDNRVQSTEIYDLTGRRVENITAPGIYIINGVKRIVR